MIDVQYEIVVRGIAPILVVQRSCERLFLPITILNDLLRRHSIDAGEPHDAREPVWKRRYDLDVKRGRHTGEKKLTAAAQDDDVVRCGDLGDSGAHHLVIHLALLLDS